MIEERDVWVFQFACYTLSVDSHSSNPEAENKTKIDLITGSKMALNWGLKADAGFFKTLLKPPNQCGCYKTQPNILSRSLKDFEAETKTVDHTKEAFIL